MVLFNGDPVVAPVCVDHHHATDADLVKVLEDLENEDRG